MGKELHDIRQDIRKLSSDIEALSKTQNQMVPMLQFCVQGFKDQDLKQGFMETLLGKLDTKADFYSIDLKKLGTKAEEQGTRLTELAVTVGKQANDLGNIGTKIKELEIKDVMRTGIKPSAPDRWDVVAEFLAHLPKIYRPLKPLLPWIVSVVSIGGAAIWEFFR